MEIISLKIKSQGPMLMHSDRFANPLDPATKAHKELTSKRKKTDEDHIAISKSEYLGSLHIDQTGPYIPAINFESCFIGAAKLQKLGVVAKRALLIIDDRIYLNYVGPKDAEGLWLARDFVDCRGVKVGASKIMRYRPKFDNWSASVQLSFDPAQISESEVIQIVKNAGGMIGVGDFRPRFGRFSVEVQ